MNAPQKKIEAATLHGAMALAFAEIEAATKDAINPHFKSKYADLGAVIAAIKPPLVAHGLFFTQHPQPSNGGVTVETFLHHASGETLSLGALFVPANKQDAQGFGSAMTYARRYALQTAFGVPTEDDDGNAAVKAGADTSGQINDGQWATLTALVDASHADVQRLCNFYQVPSLDKLPAAKFDDACEKLKAKIKQPEMAK